jgi:hypothetical protein
MAYNISDIRQINPENFPFYFFDSNVWIAQLRSLNSVPQSSDAPYLSFFEDVVELNELDRSKKPSIKPKIIVTSLLLSEIFNGYMRQVAMKVYYTNEGLKMRLAQSAAESNWRHYDFKKHYRKTDDYRLQLKKLKSDFLAYLDYMEFRDDGFKALIPATIIHSITDECDFNDFLYYYSLADQGIPIVTNDSDFCFQDISIITSNYNLLKVMRR